MGHAESLVGCCWRASWRLLVLVLCLTGAASCAPSSLGHFRLRIVSRPDPAPFFNPRTYRTGYLAQQVRQAWWVALSPHHLNPEPRIDPQLPLEGPCAFFSCPPLYPVAVSSAGSTPVIKKCCWAPTVLLEMLIYCNSF